ncbi:MAG: SH3 domain-containing protein [Hyphomicrobiaceae bacterium]
MRQTFLYWAILFVAAVACPAGRNTAAWAQGASGGAPQGSGLPVPRFVSLKSDKVHIRQGPGTDYKVLWVFTRAGLPVEVISEFESWRQVRDSEGTTGWVLQGLVSGRRTAVVLPWEVKEGKAVQVPLRGDDRESAATVAMAEAGVIANVRSCDGRWCYVSIADFRGYIEQKKLWGVYEGEVLK